MKVWSPASDLLPAQPRWRSGRGLGYLCERVSLKEMTGVMDIKRTERPFSVNSSQVAHSACTTPGSDHALIASFRASSRAPVSSWGLGGVKQPPCWLDISATPLVRGV